MKAIVGKVLVLYSSFSWTFVTAETCKHKWQHFSITKTTYVTIFFFFSSRRRHTRSLCDWSSDVCSSDLFSLCSVVAHSDQIKAARGQTLSDKHFRNVAHRNNPSAAQNHAFQPRRAVRESKNAARGDKFSNLFCRNGKPSFAQPQQDERLQFDFCRYCHCGESASSRAAAAKIGRAHV